jgi:WD40 repeat protein
VLLKIRWLVVTAVFGLILITSTSSTPTQALSVPFPPAAVGEAEMVLIGRGLPTGVAYAPDGQTLAVATNIGVWLYPLDALEDGRFLRHVAPVSQIEWSLDGQQLTVVTADNQMHVWDMATGQLLQTEEAPAEMVMQVNDSQSPNGRLQATTTEDEQTIIIQDAASGQIQQTLTGHTDAITSLAWSPDGQQLATTADDDTVRVWHVADGQLLHTLGEHYFENVRTVDWSLDGRFLLGGLGDDRLRIWTAAGELVQTLVGHTDDVTDGRWSPDGRRIASSADDGTVRLWDAANGEI